MNKIKLQKAIWLCPVVNIQQLISEFLWIIRESLTSYQERLRTKGKGVTAIQLCGEHVTVCKSQYK
jgi:hypothetical protein